MFQILFEVIFVALKFHILTSVSVVKQENKIKTENEIRKKIKKGNYKKMKKKEGEVVKQAWIGHGLEPSGGI